jgi:hypothetical protein
MPETKEILGTLKLAIALDGGGGISSVTSVAG